MEGLASACRRSHFGHCGRVIAISTVLAPPTDIVGDITAPQQSPERLNEAARRHGAPG
ncbi:hypothetical protein I552_4653 [Mycobacterium xenopi 3993]|nr:hypothetical protein I552_4653 [Mycobacterium xenopi 3993]